MSGNNGSEQNRIIKTQDENGQIYNFELIDIIEFEEREYGLLVFLDEENKSKEKENDEDDDDDEVVVMRLSKIDDSYTFETIEDDEEFEKIIAYLESESEEDEEDEEDEEFDEEAEA
ncbi:MAG TPA: DUF1292 domain-containing protein [Candidatus Gastranaerophilales bacterium]|nr:DUF1292 domain-containing protein [Candidatus Gastranaerophilales bacterium]